MSTTESRPLTAGDVLELNLDYPWELVRGEVIEMNRPTLRHGAVCVEVVYCLANWCKANSTGYVISNDAGIITEREPDTIRGPDVFYVSKTRLPAIPSEAGWLEVAPELCVEVISDGDQWTEISAMIDEYLALGVVEVWIVDPELRIVRVFRNGEAPRNLKPGDAIESPDILPGFTCPVSALFAQ